MKYVIYNNMRAGRWDQPFFFFYVQYAPPSILLVFVFRSRLAGSEPQLYEL